MATSVALPRPKRNPLLNLNAPGGTEKACFRSQRQNPKMRTPAMVSSVPAHKVTVTLWAGTVLTMAGVLILGFWRCDLKQAFSVPPGAFKFSSGFLFGLGSATLVAIYDYLGYYDICYIGDEVREPARVIPRSILYSILGCLVGYLGIHLSLIGVVPWW